MAKLAISSEKVHSSMRKMHKFRPCACAKYHPGIRSLFMNSVVASGSVSGQWRPWSDYADGQADLGLRCPHKLEDRFSQGAAQIMNGWHSFVPQRDKMTDTYVRRRHVRHHSPIRVFAVRMEKPEVLVHPTSAQVDSDQTARMRRLIWVFTGRTCPKVQFLALRMICCIEAIVEFSG